MEFIIHLATTASIYLAVAAVLRVVIVRGGVYLASGAAVFALGAYAVAIAFSVSAKLGALGYLAAPFLGAGWGFVTALVIRRMSPATAFTATLLLQGVTYLIIYNWYEPSAPVGSFRNMTNGAQGISLFNASVLGARIADLAVVAAPVLSLLTWRLVHNFERGITALALDAHRIDPITANSLGIRGDELSVRVLTLAHALLAALGGIYASLIAYVDPTLASIQSGLFLFAIGLIGIFGRTIGPLLAVLLMVVTPDLLRLYLVSEETASTVRQGIAALAVLVALLMQRHRFANAANAG